MATTSAEMLSYRLAAHETHELTLTATPTSTDLPLALTVGGQAQGVFGLANGRLTFVRPLPLGAHRVLLLDGKNKPLLKAWIPVTALRAVHRVMIGDNLPALTPYKDFTFNFPDGPYAEVPMVAATPQPEDVGLDCFSIQIRRVTTQGCTLRAYRHDGVDGWGQPLRAFIVIWQ